MLAKQETLTSSPEPTREDTMSSAKHVPTEAAALIRPESADRRREELSVLTNGLSDGEGAGQVGDAALWGAVDLAVSMDAVLAEMLLGEAKRLAERDQLTSEAISAHLRARP